MLPDHKYRDGELSQGQGAVPTCMNMAPTSSMAHVHAYGYSKLCLGFRKLD